MSYIIKLPVLAEALVIKSYKNLKMEMEKI